MPSETFYRLNTPRQSKIVSAAKKEFSSNTFENARVINICRYADIPRATFYSYFESLDDVYKYVYGLIEQDCNDYCNIDNCAESLKLEEDYFINIIKSEEGLKSLYKSMEQVPARKRALYHIITSLAMQYSLSLVTREQFSSQVAQYCAEFNIHL